MCMLCTQHAVILQVKSTSKADIVVRFIIMGGSPVVCQWTPLSELAPVGLTCQESSHPIGTSKEQYEVKLAETLCFLCIGKRLWPFGLNVEQTHIHVSLAGS